MLSMSSMTMRGSAMMKQCRPLMIACAMLAPLLLLPGYAFSQTEPDDELVIRLSPAEMDSIEAYEALLLKDVEYYRYQADSLRIEQRMLEVQNESLKQNQRKWYDELLLFGKLAALALAAKWLNDG